jgi:hypothetical protein
MRTKWTSLLALALAVAFVAGLVTQVTAADSDKAQAAQEQAAEKKVEMKGKVEEEKGKATVEMKKIEPEAEVPEAAPPAEKPE